jgi:Fe(3+) dicitrate transport protein
MDYQMQQAGGLTDEQFNANPRQSLRERNWFGTPWNVFSINFDTKISDNFTSNTKLFGLIGERNSVGFIGTPNNVDDLTNRRVDRDLYENYGIENRNIYKYKLGKINNNLAFGVRLYKANTQRLQDGRGTTGSDFDISIDGRYVRDLNFTTENVAVFAENQFKVTEKFSVTPGVRYEYIQNTGEGRFGINSSGNDVPFPDKTISRSKPLFGLGLEYKFRTTNIYANITQAFRPVLFSDFTPPAVTDVIDPNLKDASGFNADFGYRGTINNYLNFDIGLFYMKYSNRIGGVRQFVNNDPTQGTFLFRTNLGETVSKGIESFVNFNITRFFNVDQKFGNVEIFSTMSFIDARYTDFSIFSQSGQTPNVINESNLEGKRVENAPRYIHNFGLAWSKNNFSTTLQYRMTGRVFTDANNTIEPSANGVTGLLDDYKVIDFAGEYKFFKNYNLRAGINNLTNEMFATRRAAGYPGPGILPGEGRTFFLSIGAKF